MLEPIWFDKLIGSVLWGLYNRSDFPFVSFNLYDPSLNTSSELPFKQK